MLKHIAILAALLLGVALPAEAQNAEEIARAQSGQPCQGCNLFQADLSYRDLPKLDVANSRLRQANLALATMNGASFRNADLSIANLFGARFTGADFTRADLSRANLVGTYLGGARLEGADLSGAILAGADLTTARGLSQAQLDTACGDAHTKLPSGFSVPQCRKN